MVAITGASSGLGAATACLLAEKGAKVFLGARREDNLKRIAAGTGERGGTAHYRQVDVTQRQQVDQFVKPAVDGIGRSDVLINNAGLVLLSPLAALKVEEWE